MVRKGRITLQIVMSEAKIEEAKTTIVNFLKDLKDKGTIESAQGKLTYEEVPEAIAV